MTIRNNATAVRRMRTLSRRNQRGFTLVELMIASVIIAIGIALVYAGVKTYMAKDRANTEGKELTPIFTNIQAKYSQRANYSGVTCAGLINLGVFPDVRQATATTLTNRWGGSITCSVGTITSTNDVVNLTYTNVPEAECKDIVPMIEDAVRVVSVGGATVKSDNVQTDLDALGTACKAGGQNNSVVYSIGKA